LLLKGTFAPALFRPNAAASASTAEPSNLARTSGYSEGFGCQAATKSPPGPNLQSGSACLFLSGIIFFPDCVAGFQSAIRGRDALDTILQIRLVANVLSAGHTNLPKQKPNKNQPLQDFFFHLRVSILIAVKIWDSSKIFLPPTGRANMLAINARFV